MSIASKNYNARRLRAKHLLHKLHKTFPDSIQCDLKHALDCYLNMRTMIFTYTECSLQILQILLRFAG